MSTFNDRLDQIIQNYYPSWWYPMKPDAVYQSFQIKQNSVEYARLMLLMHGDFVKKTRNICQIQNPMLYEQFQLKVAESRERGPINVKELLHCTDESNINSIMKNNLNWRLVQRHKYGKGVSFSTSAAYANLESSLNNTTNRAMIVADVLVGQIQYGDHDTIIPDDPYDTTVNGAHSVYVKYCDNEFYPKYVIYYKSYPVESINGKRVVVNY